MPGAVARLAIAQGPLGGGASGTNAGDGRELPGGLDARSICGDPLLGDRI